MVKSTRTVLFAAAAVVVMVVVCAAAGVQATPAGASMSVSQSSLGYLDSVITPLLSNIISGMHLPKINKNTGGFNIQLFDIYTKNYSPGTTIMQLKSGSGIELGLQNFYLHVHVHFTAKETGFPWLSTAGTAEITTHHATVKGTIALGASNGKPTVSPANVKADVGKFDIKFNDGIIGDLANLLENLFSNQIKNALDNTVQSALTNVIKGLNKPLQNVNLDFPLASWGAHANFDLTSSPRTTSSYVGMDAVGEVVNTKKPVPPPSGVVPPNVPPFSTADASHYVQLGISTYFFESLAWVYTQAGQLQTTVQHNALPSGFVFQLNTTDLSAFAPNLSKLYPNMWCQLVIGVSNATSISASSSAGLAAAVPLSLQVQPLTPKGPITAFTIGGDMKLSLAIDVASQNLTGKVNYLSCSLMPISSHVGPVNVTGLSKIFDFVLPTIVVPMVNKILATGFPLPSMGGLTLTNSAVRTVDNAIVVASDFKLNLDIFDDQAPQR